MPSTSAFGVEHSEIDKGLKVKNFLALRRVARHGDQATRASRYAKAKYGLRLHRPVAEQDQRVTAYKNRMDEASRTPRSLRDKNRKGVF